MPKSLPQLGTLLGAQLRQQFECDTKRRRLPTAGDQLALALPVARIQQHYLLMRRKVGGRRRLFAKQQRIGILRRAPAVDLGHFGLSGERDSRYAPGRVQHFE